MTGTMVERILKQIHQCYWKNHVTDQADVVGIVLIFVVVALGYTHYDSVVNRVVLVGRRGRFPQ